MTSSHTSWGERCLDGMFLGFQMLNLRRWPWMSREKSSADVFFFWRWFWRDLLNENWFHPSKQNGYSYSYTPWSVTCVKGEAKLKITILKSWSETCWSLGYTPPKTNECPLNKSGWFRWNFLGTSDRWSPKNSPNSSFELFLMGFYIWDPLKVELFSPEKPKGCHRFLFRMVRWFLGIYFQLGIPRHRFLCPNGSSRGFRKGW